MKKTIRDFDITGKKVIIRCDFNVPIKDGIITDDNRIVESLPTIEYAINKGAKVILMSHLGRVKTEEDKQKNSLLPVSKRLNELLNRKVTFVPYTRGKEVEESIDSILNGDILLLENTRYEDIDGKLESGNDEQLGKYWSSLGDVYINDAFGTSHRSHASNVGIASNLPSGVGFLIEKELLNMADIISKPERPFTVILGGSKVSDKIGVISNLVEIADYILIGGAMSYTFLKAKGIEIGKSLLDEEMISFCKEMIDKYPNKIILPVDTVCADSISDGAKVKVCLVDSINSEDIGLDIGPLTVNLFKKYLDDSKTIIWNGPVGMFEIEKFANGTKQLCEIISKLDVTSIVGGGDTGAAIINLGYKDKFTHISTGGGASLNLLEGKSLSGIEVIDDI